MQNRPPRGPHPGGERSDTLPLHEVHSHCSVPVSRLPEWRGARPIKVALGVRSTLRLVALATLSLTQASFNTMRYKTGYKGRDR
jgi:hypothetical protein